LSRTAIPVDGAPSFRGAGEATRGAGRRGGRGGDRASAAPSVTRAAAQGRPPSSRRDRQRAGPGSLASRRCPRRTAWNSTTPRLPAHPSPREHPRPQLPPPRSSASRSRPTKWWGEMDTTESSWRTLLSTGRRRSKPTRSHAATKTAAPPRAGPRLLFSPSGALLAPREQQPWLSLISSLLRTMCRSVSLHGLPRAGRGSPPATRHRSRARRGYSSSSGPPSTMKPSSASASMNAACLSSPTGRRAAARDRTPGRSGSRRRGTSPSGAMRCRLRAVPCSTE
jgi:hypothetical protein